MDTLNAIIWAVIVCFFATIAAAVATVILVPIRLILAMGDLVADCLNLIIPEKR